jgi:hypothetical protein
MRDVSSGGGAGDSEASISALVRFRGMVGERRREGVAHQGRRVFRGGRCLYGLRSDYVEVYCRVSGVEQLQTNANARRCNCKSLRVIF